jgi:hypothetical protein
MEGYNPSVSMIPSASGAIPHMSGGAPDAYNPNISLIPSVGAAITNYRGGYVGMDPTIEAKITAVGKVKDIVGNGNRKKPNVAEKKEEQEEEQEEKEGKEEQAILEGAQTEAVKIATTIVETEVVEEEKKEEKKEEEKEEEKEVEEEKKEAEPRQIRIKSVRFTITDPLHRLLTPQNLAILEELGLSDASSEIKKDVLESLWSVPEDIVCDTNASISSVSKCEPLRRVFRSVLSHKLGIPLIPNAPVNQDASASSATALATATPMTSNEYLDNGSRGKYTPGDNDHDYTPKKPRSFMQASREEPESLSVLNAARKKMGLKTSVNETADVLRKRISDQQESIHQLHMQMIAFQKEFVKTVSEPIKQLELLEYTDIIRWLDEIDETLTDYKSNAHKQSYQDRIALYLDAYFDQKNAQEIVTQFIKHFTDNKGTVLSDISYITILDKLIKDRNDALQASIAQMKTDIAKKREGLGRLRPNKELEELESISNDEFTSAYRPLTRKVQHLGDTLDAYATLLKDALNVFELFIMYETKVKNFEKAKMLESVSTAEIKPVETKVNTKPTKAALQTEFDSFDKRSTRIAKEIDDAVKSLLSETDEYYTTLQKVNDQSASLYNSTYEAAYTLYKQAKETFEKAKEMYTNMMAESNNQFSNDNKDNINKIIDHAKESLQKYSDAYRTFYIKITEIGKEFDKYIKAKSQKMLLVIYVCISAIGNLKVSFSTPEAEQLYSIDDSVVSHVSTNPKYAVYVEQRKILEEKIGEWLKNPLPDNILNALIKYCYEHATYRQQKFITPEGLPALTDAILDSIRKKNTENNISNTDEINGLTLLIKDIEFINKTMYTLGETYQVLMLKNDTFNLQSHIADILESHKDIRNEYKEIIDEMDIEAKSSNQYTDISGTADFADRYLTYINNTNKLVALENELTNVTESRFTEIRDEVYGLISELDEAEHDMQSLYDKIVEEKTKRIVEHASMVAVTYVTDLITQNVSDASVNVPSKSPSVSDASNQGSNNARSNVVNADAFKMNHEVVPYVPLEQLNVDNEVVPEPNEIKNGFRQLRIKAILQLKRFKQTASNLYQEYKSLGNDYKFHPKKNTYSASLAKLYTTLQEKIKILEGIIPIRSNSFEDSRKRFKHAAKLRDMPGEIESTIQLLTKELALIRTEINPSQSVVQADLDEKHEEIQINIEEVEKAAKAQAITFVEQIVTDSDRLIAEITEYRSTLKEQLKTFKRRIAQLPNPEKKAELDAIIARISKKSETLRGKMKTTNKDEFAAVKETIEIDIQDLNRIIGESLFSMKNSVSTNIVHGAKFQKEERIKLVNKRLEEFRDTIEKYKRTYTEPIIKKSIAQLEEIYKQIVASFDKFQREKNVKTSLNQNNQNRSIDDIENKSKSFITIQQLILQQKIMFDDQTRKLEDLETKYRQILISTYRQYDKYIDEQYKPKALKVSPQKSMAFKHTFLNQYVEQLSEYLVKLREILNVKPVIENENTSNKYESRLQSVVTGITQVTSDLNGIITDIETLQSEFNTLYSNIDKLKDTNDKYIAMRQFELENYKEFINPRTHGLHYINQLEKFKKIKKYIEKLEEQIKSYSTLNDTLKQLKNTTQNKKNIATKRSELETYKNYIDDTSDLIIKTQTELQDIIQSKIEEELKANQDAIEKATQVAIEESKIQENAQEAAVAYVMTINLNDDTSDSKHESDSDLDSKHESDSDLDSDNDDDTDHASTEPLVHPSKQVALEEIKLNFPEQSEAKEEAIAFVRKEIEKPRQEAKLHLEEQLEQRILAYDKKMRNNADAALIKEAEEEARKQKLSINIEQRLLNSKVANAEEARIAAEARLKEIQEELERKRKANAKASAITAAQNAVKKMKQKVEEVQKKEEEARREEEAARIQAQKNIEEAARNLERKRKANAEEAKQLAEEEARAFEAQQQASAKAEAVKEAEKIIMMENVQKTINEATRTKKVRIEAEKKERDTAEKAKRNKNAANAEAAHLAHEAAEAARVKEIQAIEEAERVAAEEKKKQEEQIIEQKRLKNVANKINEEVKQHMKEENERFEQQKQNAAVAAELRREAEREAEAAQKEAEAAKRKAKENQNAKNAAAAQEAVQIAKEKEAAAEAARLEEARVEAEAIKSAQKVIDMEGFTKRQANIAANAQKIINQQELNFNQQKRNAAAAAELRREAEREAEAAQKEAEAAEREAEQARVEAEAAQRKAKENQNAKNAAAAQEAEQIAKEKEAAAESAQKKLAKAIAEEAAHKKAIMNRKKLEKNTAARHKKAAENALANMKKQQNILIKLKQKQNARAAAEREAAMELERKRKANANAAEIQKAVENAKVARLEEARVKEQQQKTKLKKLAENAEKAKANNAAFVKRIKNAEEKRRQAKLNANTRNAVIKANKKREANETKKKKEERGLSLANVLPAANLAHKIRTLSEKPKLEALKVIYNEKPAVPESDKNPIIPVTVKRPSRLPRNANSMNALLALGPTGSKVSKGAVGSQKENHSFVPVASSSKTPTNPLSEEQLQRTLKKEREELAKRAQQRLELDRLMTQSKLPVPSMVEKTSKQKYNNLMAVKTSARTGRPMSYGQFASMQSAKKTERVHNQARRGGRTICNKIRSNKTQKHIKH